MERLPTNRADNIDRMEREFKEAFIKEVQDKKEQDRQRDIMRMQRINDERGKRYEEILERRRKENMILVDYSDKDKVRERNTTIKMQERKARDDALIGGIMERHRKEAADHQAKVDKER